MDYGMSELVPIVGKLAEKYTGHEHTSISYESIFTRKTSCRGKS